MIILKLQLFIHYNKCRIETRPAFGPFVSNYMNIREANLGIQLKQTRRQWKVSALFGSSFFRKYCTPANITENKIKPKKPENIVNFSHPTKQFILAWGSHGSRGSRGQRDNKILAIILQNITYFTTISIQTRRTTSTLSFFRSSHVKNLLITQQFPLYLPCTLSVLYLCFASPGWLHHGMHLIYYPMYLLPLFFVSLLPAQDSLSLSLRDRGSLRYRDRNSEKLWEIIVFISSEAGGVLMDQQKMKCLPWIVLYNPSLEHWKP